MCTHTHTHSPSDIHTHAHTHTHTHTHRPCAESGAVTHTQSLREKHRKLTWSKRKPRHFSSMRLCGLTKSCRATHTHTHTHTRTYTYTHMHKHKLFMSPHKQTHIVWEREHCREKTLTDCVILLCFLWRREASLLQTAPTLYTNMSHSWFLTQEKYAYYY